MRYFDEQDKIRAKTTMARLGNWLGSRPMESWGFFVAGFIIAVAFVTVALLSTVGPLWYLRSLRSDLPTKDAITRIGEMDQATAVYDRHDQLAFTIFKEQRIETPLASVSPHLIHAII